MYTEADAKRALDRLEALEKQIAKYKDRTADLEQRVTKLEETRKSFAKGPISLNE
jgi:cell division protein FtsB